MATLLTCLVFVVTLQFRAASSQIVGRTIAGRYDCCGASVMDSSRHVLLQQDSELVRGTFLAVKVQFCTTDGAYLQVWRPVILGNNSSYQLKWQIYYKPTVYTNTGAMTILNFRDKPLTLTEGDRIGFFSSDLSKIPVPYMFDKTKYALYRSKEEYSEDHVFSLNAKIELASLKWPRSFKPFVVFCSQEDCPQFANDDVGVARDIPGAGPPGPPGPEGPPGPAGKANPFPVQCDAPDLSGVNTALTELQQRNAQMQQKVDEMTEILRGLSTSSKVTGICPSGFSAGWYGVGKCYLVIRDRIPAYSAQLRCRNYKAQLVAIESKSENDYLANTIYKQGPKELETYWTSGMYRWLTKQWVWHNENMRTQTQFDYSNWAQGVPPVNVTASSKTCLTMTVGKEGTESVTSRWRANVCQTKHYFICEIPKECL